MRKIKLFAIVLLLTVSVALLSGCVAKVPIPEVKEGRFDFSFTYEINGEVKTYSGVYVCRFDGVYTTLIGSGIEWDGYIENEEDTVIAIQNNKDGIVYIDPGFFPEYFMNDPGAVYYGVPEPSLYMIYHNDDPDVTESTCEEEVIAEYGVKFIGYEYADPIENEFKEKLSFSSFEPTIN